MNKTVLFDGNNIAIMNLFSDGVLVYNNDRTKVLSYDWETWRFNFFSSIYYGVTKAEGDEVVIAIDGNKHDLWRIKYWPRYKESRKKNELIDWGEFFKEYFSFMVELMRHFPFKIIRDKFSEGDDIIGTIVLNTPQNHHIVSSDKDYIQLYNPNRVSIYSPRTKKELKHPRPDLFIIEQCLTGQSKDDIFNIKTPLDYPKNKRKPGFGVKSAEKVFIYGWKKWLKDNNLEERFEFNRNLMDFSRIPASVQQSIMKKYNKKNYPHPDKMYTFMKKHKWNHFLDEWTKVEYNLLPLF